MESWRQELYTSELYHHGIIGQKWGVRRYQNEDGSLTNSGKRRYNNGTTVDGKSKAPGLIKQIKTGKKIIKERQALENEGYKKSEAYNSKKYQKWLKSDDADGDEEIYKLEALAEKQGKEYAERALSERYAGTDYKSFEKKARTASNVEATALLLAGVGALVIANRR